MSVWYFCGLAKSLHMSKLSVSVPHELTKPEAMERIKGLLENLKKDQADMISDVKEEWKDDQGKFSFSAKGFDLSGLISVTDSDVEINAEVPFAVSLFSGTIKKIISEKAKTLLEKK